jgi:hypothetical protein
MTDLRAQMRSALSKAHTAKDIDRFLDDYFPEGSVLVTPETLAAAMRALPPIPDEFLLRKTWVESDWTPNVRDYADAILADLTPEPTKRCAPYGNPHPNGRPCADCIAYGYDAPEPTDDGSVLVTPGERRGIMSMGEQVAYQQGFVDGQADARAPSMELIPEPSGVCPECGCGWNTRRHGPGDPLGCFKPALTKTEPWNPDGVQP